jgi:eukaryotic-like serine/threonine-protein kinase
MPQRCETCGLVGQHEGETLPFDEDEQTHLANHRVGRLLRERWHLDELLGVGGMAAVYAATHRNGKRVAIKMLHAELSHHAEAKRCFIDEGYLANRVEHSGVVSILDDDVAEDGAAFLVMDLLEGETLEVRLTQKGQLEPLEILPLMDDLLDVLVAAHARGIVHCDIKPTNIFITRNEQLKLLDFGIARLSDAARGEVEPRSTMGTPAFMAPEHARGRSEQLDGRTDLWAVGATMFMALTGRHVHEAETNNEQLHAAMTRPAPSLASVAPNLPKPLVDLVDRALAFERDERWPDARAMRTALRDVHAILVEEHIGSGSPRDPLVTLDDLGPPMTSHAPVTLTTARALALSQGFENGSLAPPHAKRGQRRALALGIGVLLVAIGAWAGSRRQLTLRTSAATVQPTPAPTAAPWPAAIPGTLPHGDAVPHREEVAQETAGAKQEPATDRSDAVHVDPLHGQKASHAATKAPTRPSTGKIPVAISPASPTLVPAQKPPPAADPTDPLDRRR